LKGIAGTSAVAPLWAALIARINQALVADGSNRLGYWNPLLYTQPALRAAMGDIAGSHNDTLSLNGDGTRGYPADADWDACTGWGSPKGNQLLSTLLSL
jgi:kumamolisin